MYNETETSRLCTFGPTSFVYSVLKLSSYIKAGYNGPFESFYSSLGASVKYGEFSFKYRNSYCAICHGAWEIGCDVQRTYWPGDDLQFQQQMAGTGPLVFKYVLDLSNRTCERDSDYYLTYSDSITGKDICEGVTQELRSCNCSQVFDIPSQSCVSIDLPVEHICDQALYTEPSPRPSSYAKTCSKPVNYTILPSEERDLACLQCLTNGGCHAVVEIRYNYTSQRTVQPTEAQLQMDILCAQSLLTPRCAFNAFSPDCARVAFEGGKGSGSFNSQINGKIILNSLAITHSKTVFSISIHYEDSIRQSGFEVMFSSSLTEYDSVCISYKNTSGEFLVCPGGNLQTVNGSVVDDYTLQWDGLNVCEAKSELVYTAEIYDYVLLSISLLVILGYNTYYLIRLPCTITGNVVFCSLATTFAAQLAYLMSYIDSITETAFCPVLAILKQYLHLSVMFWTNSLAIWIAAGFTRATLAANQSKNAFIACALHGWMTPLVFIVLTLILQYGPQTIFYPVLTVGNPCFLNDTSFVRLLVFLGPIYLVIFINFALAATAALTLCCGTRASNSDRDRLIKNIMIVVKLVFLFGLHWVLLFLADYITQPEVQRGLWTATKVLTESQGFLVVLAQIIKLGHLRKAMHSISSLKSTLLGDKKSSNVGLKRAKTGHGQNYKLRATSP